MKPINSQISRRKDNLFLISLSIYFYFSDFFVYVLIEMCDLKK